MILKAAHNNAVFEVQMTISYNKIEKANKFFSPLKPLGPFVVVDRRNHGFFQLDVCQNTNQFVCLLRSNQLVRFQCSFVCILSLFGQEVAKMADFAVSSSICLLFARFYSLPMNFKQQTFCIGIFHLWFICSTLINTSYLSMTNQSFFRVRYKEQHQ